MTDETAANALYGELPCTVDQLMFHVQDDLRGRFGGVVAGRSHDTVPDPEEDNGQRTVTIRNPDSKVGFVILIYSDVLTADEIAAGT